MHDVVPGEGQELTWLPFQLTLFPLVLLLVPEVKDVGVVPSREIRNPWQYPPGDGFDAWPMAGIGP